MFDNVGRTIKNISIAAFFVGVISSFGLGFVIANLFDGDSSAIGVAIFVAFLGVVFSFVSVLLFYGFGELIENSAIIAANTSNGTMTNNKSDPKQVSSNKAADNKENNEPKGAVSEAEDEYVDFFCPQCGKSISYTRDIILESEELTCPNCLKSFPTKDVKL